MDEGTIDPADQKIYTINCLSALDHTISSHPCCSNRSQQLNKRISSQLSALVAEQAGSVLVKSGIAEIADRIRHASWLKAWMSHAPM